MVLNLKESFMEVTGKTCLITGGLSGIGLALAKEACLDKMHLVLVQRSDDPKAVADLKKRGAASVTVIQKDLSQNNSIKELMSEIDAKKIDVDVLVNNAGLLTGGLIEDQKDEDIIKMLDVNLKALIILSKAFVPRMLKKKSGKIVNNSSVSGVMCIPCASTYAAAKSGVVSFTKCIRQELENTGVSTLLMYTPGIDTNMYKDIEKLYGEHMDLDFLTSIKPEAWAKKVWQAVKDDDDEVLPSGSGRVGLWISRHLPKVFEGQMQKYFNRG